MTTEILLRYTHFICIFIIVGTLSVEFALLKKQMTRFEIARLAKIDSLYGIAALILIAAGLTLWLGSYGKPSVYYTKNWVFHTKILTFLIVGILSIKPTIFFIKQRKGDPKEIVTIPSTIYLLIRWELTLLLIIPLLAGLMSHGVGLINK